MQITLNIPDEIPQEIVNQLMIRINKQIKAAKRLAVKNSQRNEEAIKEKARQDLAQMVYKLRESAAEIGFVNEDEISQWVNEAREKHAGHY
jgi:hypothetical protein